jgi:dTDP-glucose 4,6-dehydratase
MPKKFKKILITGADGFIGSHLTEELIRRGYKTRSFVFYNSFNSWGWLDYADPKIKKSLDIFAGDIRDPHGVKTAMKGCDAILHLAALIAIPYSYHSPDTYIDTNVKGTLNLLRAARELKLKKFVHTSTSEVYGTAQFVPITEDHPLQAQSPYSASKIGADQIALSFYRSFGTPVTVLRPFNTFGPRQSARAIIPTIITQVAMGKKKLKLGSLHPTRDFNYIKDTVNGFIAALEAPKTEGETINIGSNRETSVKEIAELISQLMGQEIEIGLDGKRIRPKASEVDRLWASNTKAKKILNWQPTYGSQNGLKRALLETIEWYRQPENLKQYKPNIYNI